jgi:hypothetical protein
MCGDKVGVYFRTYFKVQILFQNINLFLNLDYDQTSGRRPPLGPKKWLLLTGGPCSEVIYAKKYKMKPKNSGRSRQLVAKRRWSFAYV